MASSTVLMVATLFFLCRPAAGCYDYIISFGDSIADTGNHLISFGSSPCRVANAPYGQTFFHRPTGRYCDGRIILDFIAEALGKPFLPPFLGGGSGGNFVSGVNFAVAGATALDSEFFGERGLSVTTWTNYTLGVQMEWFKQLLPSLCSTHLHSNSDCKELLSKSLFLVGEIGGNDVNHPFFQGWTMDAIGAAFVPEIIRKISSTIDELVELGARTLLVPGNFPIGCSPAYLSSFQNLPAEDYDPRTGCINRLNDFAMSYNRWLLQELDRLRQRHPHAAIIYADYYSATMSIYNSSNPFGFGSVPLASCCGSGSGPYNFNRSAMCGTKAATKVCSDPSRFASWDGIHFTEAAYRTIAAGLLSGAFTSPPFNRICPNLVQGTSQAQQTAYSK